ncbi:MAG TPA: methyltransferase domain-containing protein [Chroococcales cyanobacterium]
MTSDSFQYQGSLLSIVERVSLSARLKMLESLIRAAAPGADTSVLDLGVTSDPRIDSNFFEKYYKFPEKITAVGLEDASFLETSYPGLRFVRADALALPFPDRSFDLVVSFAVIEHVGSEARQRQFLAEACRVGRRVFITTPNRYFPVEFHTLVPFLHWLPPGLFRRILRFFGQRFFSQEENLNLLSEQQLLSMVPAEFKVTRLHHRLLGMRSNLILFLESTVLDTPA